MPAETPVLQRCWNAQGEHTHSLRSTLFLAVQWYPAMLMQLSLLSKPAMFSPLHMLASRGSIKAIACMQ